MRFFKVEEFNCPCCGLNNMAEDVMRKIDQIRYELDKPLKINSGTRCPKHNAEVGGKPESYHLFGKAIDVSTTNLTDEEKHTFLHLVKREFKGIGAAKTFLHMDIRVYLAFWVY